MDDNKPLTEREILIIEKMGVLKQLLEIHELIFAAMVVRCGGDVNIKNDELDYARKNYILMSDISTEDYTRNVRMRVRLK